MKITCIKQKSIKQSQKEQGFGIDLIRQKVWRAKVLFGIDLIRQKAWRAKALFNTKFKNNTKLKKKNTKLKKNNTELRK